MECAQVLTEAKLEGLIDFVHSCAQSLNTQTSGSAEELNDKFSTTAKFQMTYGSLSLFYGGLESLLGPPKMYKGSTPNAEKSLLNMMEHEHCGFKDSKVTFSTPNGTTTTSATEWAVIVYPDAGSDSWAVLALRRDSRGARSHSAT